MRQITANELKSLINDGESSNVELKEQWHEDNAELVHDILCITNANHEKNRFIIFGVTDDGQIRGISTEGIQKGKRKNNDADIIDMLRNSGINKIPEIKVYTIIIENKNIDIVQIARSLQRPYFLLKDKKSEHNKNSTIVRAGVKYTRNGSANTPKTSTASENEIENMFRERFGLDISPLERMGQYLIDSDGWYHENEADYYKQFPEFTIRNLNKDSIPDCDQEWTRGEIGHYYAAKNNTAYYRGLFYHSTILEKIRVVVFDDRKKIISAPDWVAIGGGRLYYYCKNTTRYKYQHYLSKHSGKDDSKNLRKSSLSGNGNFDIPVFKDTEELDKFLRHASNKFDGEKLKSYVPETEETKQNQIFYKLLDELQLWQTNSSNQ